MNLNVNDELWAFSERFVQVWQHQNASLPRALHYSGLGSPCHVQDEGEFVVWQPKKRDELADFTDVEQGIGIVLHADIKAFYANQYAADMPARFNGLALTLIQVWSEADLERLKENMLGHLFMQRKLKHDPSLFIASTENELEIITLCNQSGEVMKEKIGTTERYHLSPSLSFFLNHLVPAV